MDDAFSKVFPFILNPEFHGWLLFLKVVFSITAAAMVVFIFYFIFASQWLKERYFDKFGDFWKFNSKGSQTVNLKQWKKISKRLSGRRETDWKLAIIEADDLVNSLVKRMGYGAATFPERIKKMAEKDFPDLKTDGILESHEIRRSISHDQNFRLSNEQAKQALADYEKFLKETELLG